MQIGIGLDTTPRISFAEQRAVIRAAVGMGYETAWTPAGLRPDAVQTCVQWAQAVNGDDGAGGTFSTGISVVPVPIWTPMALASVAATAGTLTNNRFTLGIGTGSIMDAGYRATYGLPNHPPVALMREWLTSLRGLMAGEKVELAGKTMTLGGVQLEWPQGERPHVPVHLAALGPQMLRLAGSHADGAALNWCTPEQIAWSRERVAEGAVKAGRDPSAIAIGEYIRVCVDEDEEVARRAFTRAVMGYAVARPGAAKDIGYRAHFGRMGFDDVLSELEERRDRGASEAEVIESFPRDLLLAVGYFGTAAGAAAAFRRLAVGLDVALVRIVPARPGVQSVMNVIGACRPDCW